MHLVADSCTGCGAHPVPPDWLPEELAELAGDGVAGGEVAGLVFSVAGADGLVSHNLFSKSQYFLAWCFFLVSAAWQDLAHQHPAITELVLGIGNGKEGFKVNPQPHKL